MTETYRGADALVAGVDLAGRDIRVRSTDTPDFDAKAVYDQTGIGNAFPDPDGPLLAYFRPVPEDDADLLKAISDALARRNS